MADNTSSSIKSTGSSLRQNSRQASGAKSMAELMAKQGSNLQILQRGQTVEGTIKKLTPSEILMDIGAKGDALVIEYDRQNLENLLSYLKVGDYVRATVISAESEEGFPVLSLRRTLDDIIFKRFEELSKNEEAFEVTVVEDTRGGYFAQTAEGVRGFLPNSQVLPGDSITGKKIMVKILEFDRPKKRVVFSQKATHYVMNPETIKKYVKRNDIIEAKVTSVTPYGIFAAITPKDAVKIEGFVHISEVSYERVENLISLFKVGQDLKAQVLDIDLLNKRVNLSIKRTQKDAFEEAKTRYSPEKIVKGVVKAVRSRGVTIEIESGISGFIPSDKIPHFAEASRGKPSGYNIGDTIECEVVEVDERRRVIIVSPVLKAVPIGYR